MKKRSVYDLSNYHMLDTFPQDIVPLNVVEMLPNTLVRGHSEALVRLSSPKRPFMHPLKIKVFHFFVPTRILWPNWEKFITQGAYGSTPPVHPTLRLLGVDECFAGSLPNHMGISPLAGDDELTVSALPFAAYNAIIRQFFADEDLAANVLPNAECVDGDNTGLIPVSLWKAAWRKDYFTAARPWAQKSPAIPIPQSGVVSNGLTPELSPQDAGDFPDNTNLSVYGGSPNVRLLGTNSTTDTQVKFGDETGLEMDDSATMRDLSIAGALQLFFENRAQYGSRLIDYLRKAFGSKISDSVLQNPQLVNYAEKTLKISEVLQTAPSDDSEVGTLRGHGIGGLGTNQFTYNIKEHGWWITLAYIMPEPAYLNSMEKFWLKRTFDEYYQKEFNSIGQVPIKNIEVNQYHTSPTETFGWTMPYDEYRRTLHIVSGTFQTDDKDWHMFREIPNSATLNNSFVTGAPTERIFFNSTTPNYKIMNYNKLIARSVVPRSVRKRIL